MEYIAARQKSCNRKDIKDFIIHVEWEIGESRFAAALRGE